MARVMVIDAGRRLSPYLMDALNKSPAVDACHLAPRLRSGYANVFAMQDIDTVVYGPRLRGPCDTTPDLAEAETVVVECVRAGVSKVVLVSSAMVYGASPRNSGFIVESQPPSYNGQNRIGQQWLALEELATRHLSGSAPVHLTVLRLAAMPLPGGVDYFSRILRGRVAVTLPLHDPPLQLLSPDDAADAVCCAVAGSAAGVFNVAPDGVIPLRTALRLAGSRRIGVARVVQRVARRAVARLAVAHPPDQLEYIRYSWTISHRKISREFGFVPRRSSAEALLDFLTSAARRTTKPKRQTRNRTVACPSFDDFGMDPRYIEACARTIFTFLHDYYWRIEVKGLEHIPHQGRAVLAGVHRGFMPFDGVMAFHAIGRKVGRYPRFLIHPGLLKIPLPFDFAKLGGIKICRENADYVLQRDQLLAIFPEGIQGAFRFYRQAYQLGKFGRDEYVKAALRNRAPIIPFVTVGSAEIFPIVGRIDWRWWRQVSSWPFIPVTPTFPLLPLPLPSKWHTQFLPPLHVEARYPAEAAEDAATVRAISQEVRKQMQAAIDDMRARRRSIFFGSIWPGGGR